MNNYKESKPLALIKAAINLVEILTDDDISDIAKILDKAIARELDKLLLPKKEK